MRFLCLLYCIYHTDEDQRKSGRVCINAVPPPCNAGFQHRVAMNAMINKYGKNSIYLLVESSSDDGWDSGVTYLCCGIRNFIPA